MNGRSIVPRSSVILLALAALLSAPPAWQSTARAQTQEDLPSGVSTGDVPTGVVSDSTMITETEAAQMAKEPLDIKKLLQENPVPGTEGEPREMSLRDVVIATLQQNLNIQIRELDRDSASEEVFGQYGIYDPTLNAGVTRTKIDQQSSALVETPSGELVQADPLDEGFTTTEASIDQLLPLGTRLSIFATDTRDRISDSRSAVFLTPTYDQALGVEVVQPLLKNFGPTVNNAGIRISEKRLQIANEGFRLEIQARLFEVMRAYWDLVFAVYNLDVERQALISARELERVNQARVDVGSIPRLNLIQAQAQVAFREARLIEREAEFLDAQDTLLRLMNWDRTDLSQSWNRPIVPTDVPEYRTDLNLQDEEWVQVAFLRRPEYIQEQISLEIAEIARDVARRQRLPELDLFGAYTYSGLDDSRWGAFDELDDFDYASYSFGARFRFPLVNRRARADYRIALDEVERSQLAIEQTEVNITTEVRASTRAIRTALKRIIATTRQVEADIEKLESEKKRQVVGERTTFDVLDFQDDLAESRANQARALADYQIALVSLARTSGVLLDAQRIFLVDQLPPDPFEFDFQPDLEPPYSTEQVPEWSDLSKSQRLSQPGGLRENVEQQPE